MKPTVTTIEAARLLGCTPQTIRDKMRDDELTGYRVGRHIRVEVDSIKAFIERNRIGEKQNE